MGMRRGAFRPGDKATDLSARRAELEFGGVDVDTFARLLRRAGRSAETAGAIKSQYARELKEGDSSVGTLGFFACGRLVGALSFGRVREVLDPSRVSGRIDVVITEPDCRGCGIAGLLVSKLLEDLDAELGERLSNLSVLAIHPAIVRIVERFGFAALSHGETPLYSLRLDDPARARCLELASSTLRTGITRLRNQCVRCQRHLWVKPWCETP